jgi:protein-tyrosine phosphatase
MRTQIYWIEGPWPGKLAIIPRPRGGDWLEDEARLWRQAGLDVIVSLLTNDEVAEMNLAQEAEFSRAKGLTYYSFPVADVSVPSSRADTLGLLDKLASALAEGENVGVHCRQGIGRSALIAASLLVLSGAPAEKAFQQISDARGRDVPETPEQRQWVIELERESAASRSKQQKA